jgi:hypothetical protein
MNNPDHQQQRDAEREAQRIRSLLRQHGGREYDPSREDDHYEGGFEISVGKPGGPHHIGGFRIDPFRVWPEKMRQYAATLAEHGYKVEVSPYIDGDILAVTPPASRPRKPSWLRRLFSG